MAKVMILIAAAICIMSQVNAQEALSAVLESKGLTTLKTTLESRSLMATLEGLDGLTLFAPTNAALSGELPTGETLDNILKFHALPIAVRSVNITNDMTQETVNGAKLRFNIYGNIYTAQCQEIDTTDGMVNIPIANGFVHVVKSILPIPTQNAYGVLSLDDLSTLKGAVDKTDLKGTLEGDGPFTVFAPANDATNIGTLNMTDVAALKAAIEYHVVPGTYCSKGLTNDMELATAATGKKIKIVLKDNKVYVNDDDGAQVTDADNAITNGVAHLINKVLVVDEGPASGSVTFACSIATMLSAALIAIFSLL